MEPLEHVGGAVAGDSISGECEHAINPTMLRLVLSHLNYHELEPAAKKYFERDFEMINRLNDTAERTKFAQFDNLVKPFEKYLSDKNKTRLNEIRELLNKKDSATDTLIPIHDLVDRTKNTFGQSKQNYDFVKQRIVDFSQEGLIQELPEAILHSPDWKNEIPDFFNLLQFIPFTDREGSNSVDNICYYSSLPIIEHVLEKGDYTVAIEIADKITQEEVRNRYFWSLFITMWKAGVNTDIKDFSELKPVSKDIYDIINRLSPSSRSTAFLMLIESQINHLRYIKDNREIKQIRGSEIETDFTNKLEEILNSIKELNLQNTRLLDTIEMDFPEFRDRVEKFKSEVT